LAEEVVKGRQCIVRLKVNRLIIPRQYIQRCGLHGLSSSLKSFALILRKRCSLKYIFVALTKRVIAVSVKYSEKQIKYPIG
jgi:hypothetical protein